MSCFGSLAFGPYTATYTTPGSSGATYDLGLIEQAWFLESQAEVRDIRAARYGESIIGGIYLGQNAFLITRLKEWTPGVQKAIHPWAVDGNGNADLGNTGVHGRCVEDLAGVLTLTAIIGTPARTTADTGLGPITIVAPKAIYAPRHNLQIPFGNLERDVHVVFQLYPQLETGSTNKLIHYWTT